MVKRRWEKKGPVTMAGKEEDGYCASVFKTKNTSGVTNVRPKQSYGQIYPRRYRGVSKLFIEIVDKQVIREFSIM